MPKLHALIPAAGLSRRMGQPKLMMKIGGTSIIRRLVQQLKHPEIESVNVLVRPDDEALAQEVHTAGANPVIASAPPPDMRASVECLVNSLVRQPTDDAESGWLLIPADHPVISAVMLHHLIFTWQRAPGSIVIPTYNGRRGHPTLFPNWLAEELPNIPEGNGINWLVHAHQDQINETPCADPSILWDVDTPEDFQRIRKILED